MGREVPFKGKTNAIVLSKKRQRSNLWETICVKGKKKMMQSRKVRTIEKCERREEAEKS